MERKLIDLLRQGKGAIANDGDEVNRVLEEMASIIRDQQSEIKKLNNELQDAKSILKFYSEPSMYVMYRSALDGVTNDIHFDGGRRARRFLEQ